ARNSRTRPPGEVAPRRGSGIFMSIRLAPPLPIIGRPRREFGGPPKDRQGPPEDSVSGRKDSDPLQFPWRHIGAWRAEMRVVLADRGSGGGLGKKATAVGGYGQRMTGFCTVARLGVFLRRRSQDPPSVTLGYLAAILARAGHEVEFTRSEVKEADVALVL